MSNVQLIVVASLLVALSCMAAHSEVATLLGDGYTASIDERGKGIIATESESPFRVWGINCKVDQFSDEKICTVFQYVEGGITIRFDAAAEPSIVCINGHDFPGRTGLVSIDKAPAVETDTDGCIGAADIFPLLLDANVVSTRMMRWPYDTPIDAEVPVIGLENVLDVVRRITARKP